MLIVQLSCLQVVYLSADQKNGFNRVVEPSMVYALDLLLIGDDVEEADSRWAESRSSYKNISILKSMNESVV